MSQENVGLWDILAGRFSPLDQVTHPSPGQSLPVIAYAVSTYFSKSQILPFMEQVLCPIFVFRDYYWNMLLEKQKAFTSYWKAAGLLIV